MQYILYVWYLVADDNNWKTSSEYSVWFVYAHGQQNKMQEIVPKINRYF